MNLKLRSLIRKYGLRYRVVYMAEKQGIPLPVALARADLIGARSYEEIQRAFDHPWTIQIQARATTWQQRLATINSQYRVER